MKVGSTKIGVTITQDRVKQVKLTMLALASQDVLVGIPDINAAREPDPNEPTDINNAQIGYMMEFGVPEQNIPARPSLVPGVQDALPRIQDRQRKTAVVALDGDLSAIERGLNGVGLIAQAAVRHKIDTGPFVPLAEVTLARRRAHGRTGTKPLLDKGEFRNAQNYVIRKRGA